MDCDRTLWIISKNNKGNIQLYRRQMSMHLSSGRYHFHPLQEHAEQYLQNSNICNVAPLEPTKQSIYNSSPLLGSHMKTSGFSSLKRISIYLSSFMDLCMVLEDLLIDAAELRMIPSASPSYTTRGFLGHVPVPHTSQDMKRVDKSKSVFASIDSLTF
ncbi:hypothetical protein L873DRAFT_1793215 [Choiromyces venosus 120613-1]|uniref:Uncharacterized protein n=1 Tax=Choiromyces venosus 120613-1 TaxID=1336337 RepID=A0A3N4J7A4_9PEZI|nr:hypothetical protein L873DRAFT_1793215 [Choiromyces venosus 120613-1]